MKKGAYTMTQKHEKETFSRISLVLKTVRSESSLRLLLIIPAMVFLSVLFVYPILKLLVMSLFDPNLTGDHFLRAFMVPAYFVVLVRTFSLSLTVTFICLLLAYPLAMLIVNVSTKVRTRLLFLVLIPFWTSILIRTYAWIVILQKGGLVNQLLMGIGLISEPLALMYNRFGVIVGMTHILLPFYIFPLVAVMIGIDKNLVKAALSLGATPVKAFIRVFFPLSFPGIAAGGLLVFILALGFFITPALMGGHQDVMIAGLIENQVRIVLNWNFASALSIVLIFATVVLFLIASRWFGLKRIWSGF